MISVSSRFKYAVKDGLPVTPVLGDHDSEDIVGFKMLSFGEPMTASMRQLEVTTSTSLDITHGDIESFKLSVDSYDEIDLGEVTITGGDPVVLTITNHGLITGDMVYISGGTLPDELDENTRYIAYVIGDDDIQLALSLDDINDSNFIATTGSGSGTHNLYKVDRNATGDTYDVEYGSFILDEIVNEHTDMITYRFYDLMYLSARKYQAVMLDYPVGLKEFLGAICTRLGWTLGTSSFLNDDFILEGDPYALLDMSYRDILEQIAELTGTTIRFNNNDELVLDPPDDTIQEEIDSDVVLAHRIKSPWGEKNSFAIRRDPPGSFVHDGGYYGVRLLTESGDRILTESEDIITTEQIIEIDDIFQIRIVNNVLLHDNPQNYIDSLSSVFDGFEYYPFDMTTAGLGYFEVGDRVKFIDYEDNEYELYIYEIESVLRSGTWREVYKADQLTKSYSSRVEPGIEYIKKVSKLNEYGTDNLSDGAVTDVKVSSISADKIVTGTMQARMTVTGVIVFPDPITNEPRGIFGFKSALEE